MNASARSYGIYWLPVLGLTGWGVVFLDLAISGRLRTLLHPFFWPVEEGCAVLLIALALGYLTLFRPVVQEIDAAAFRGALWQTTILLAPLFIATALAPASFSAAALDRRAGLAGGRTLAQASSSGGHADRLELVDFAAAAFYPEQIPRVSGRRVTYLAQYFHGKEGEFRVCRVLMSCCASDAMPIYLHVIGPAPQAGDLDWLNVEGETFFRKDDEGQWTPCLRLIGTSPAKPPPDPYLYPVRMKQP